MNAIQVAVVSVLGIISLLIVIRALYELLENKNSFGKTVILFWLGIFVWGDGVVLGFFWLSVV